MPKQEAIKIEKNIPFPPDIRRGRKSPYPWLEMKVGDSFAFDGSLINAQAATTYHGSRTGRTFRARAYNGHVRIWRMK